MHKLFRTVTINPIGVHPRSIPTVESGDERIVVKHSNLAAPLVRDGQAKSLTRTIQDSLTLGYTPQNHMAWPSWATWSSSLKKAAHLTAGHQQVVANGGARRREQIPTHGRVPQDLTRARHVGTLAIGASDWPIAIV